MRVLQAVVAARPGEDEDGSADVDVHVAANVDVDADADADSLLQGNYYVALSELVSDVSEIQAEKGIRIGAGAPRQTDVSMHDSRLLMPIDPIVSRALSRTGALTKEEAQWKVP